MEGMEKYWFVSFSVQQQNSFGNIFFKANCNYFPYKEIINLIEQKTKKNASIINFFQVNKETFEKAPGFPSILKEHGE